MLDGPCAIGVRGGLASAACGPIPVSRRSWRFNAAGNDPADKILRAQYMPPRNMKNYEFSSLSEYLKIVASLSRQFNCHHSDIWYRGLKDDALALVPGIIWRKVSEQREESLVAEFMTYFSNYTDKRPATAFDYYTLMQHYGLPTRLLDWSLSPLVSLFFALEENNDGKRRAVWAIRPHPMNGKAVDFNGVMAPNSFKNSHINNYLPKYLRDNQNLVPTAPVAVSVPFMNQRVTSQKGAFTIHGFSEEPINEFYERNELLDIAKLCLKSEDCRGEILNDLYSAGIKEDDIYQDLNSLSIRIMREFNI
jgi:hypothetical protein